MRLAYHNSFASIALAVAPLGAASTGCTGTVAGLAGGAPDAEPAVTQAVVLVERAVDPTEGARATASARFARVAAGVTPADTLRAIGASLDLPAKGSCAGIRPTDVSGGSTDPVPFVELLDMGRVSIEAAGAVTSLVPRQLPYVTDVVTGTVYARAAEASLLPAAAPYVIHVSGQAGQPGAADVPGFDVAAAAPPDATDVVVAQETTPGRIALSGSGVDFSWPAGPAARSGGDPIYVEVQPAGVRCTLGDGLSAATTEPTTGAEGMARASLAASLFNGVDGAGSLVVHRVHVEPLQTVARAGIDGGEVRFDFSRVLTYARP